MLGGEPSPKTGLEGCDAAGGVSLSPGLCWRKGDRVGRGSSEGWGDTGCPPATVRFCFSGVSTMQTGGRISWGFVI